MPSEITGLNAARQNARSISLQTCCRPFWITARVIGSRRSVAGRFTGGEGLSTSKNRAKPRFLHRVHKARGSGEGGHRLRTAGRAVPVPDHLGGGFAPPAHGSSFAPRSFVAAGSLHSA